MQTQPDGYATPQRVIHWIMAVLILPMSVVGFVMIQEGLPRPVQNSLFFLHKNIGVLLLILAMLRVVIRMRNAVPPLPQHVPAWQRRMAAASHRLLYVLICLMPLSGYIRVRAGGFPIEILDRLGVPTLVPRSDALAEVAKTVHEYGAYALAAFLALHIAAALYHLFVLRDSIFRRIWPIRRV